MASSKARTGRQASDRAEAGKVTAGIPLATPNRPARSVRPRPAEGSAAEPGRDDVTNDLVEAEPEPARPGPARSGPAQPGPALSGPPPWLQWTTLVLALIGLGISIYETYAHFNGNHLAGCPVNAHATFDCTAVITSPESMVFGVIPVAILGLAFYVFAVAIMSPWAWRASRREVHWLRLVSMIVGIGFVLYLVYAELAQIGQICEYCTGVHVVTFVLFCITVLSAAIWGLRAAGTEMD